MEHSRENIVKHLKAMSKNSWDVAQIVPELKVEYEHESSAYDVAVSLLTDKDFFNGLCKIYGIEESEGAK